MAKVATLFFCLFLVGTFVASHHLTPLGSGALAFEPVHQSLIVTIKKDKDDDDDEKPKKDKKAKNCKKARCEPGMFVLDKPNIYGACCQAGAEPLKHKTAPAEKEKCKFPGEVGEPPNCKCPDDTEFMGYKGCVKKVEQKVCCTGVYPNGVSTGKSCGAPEAAVRKITSSGQLNGVPIVESSITCAPEK